MNSLNRRSNKIHQAAPLLSGKHRGVSGFTLLEVLIVSFVIALLSSIAVINIQTFVDNNKRKAVIADLRNMATAMGFAHDDFGIYPKLCFLRLDKRDPRLSFVDTASGDPDGIGGLHLSLQTYGLDYVAGGATPSVLNNWNGPYMAVSAGRGGSAQGVGGLSLVSITPDIDVPDGNVQLWPADTYGNPYVVYLATWELDGNTYRRRFIGVPLDGDRNRGSLEFRESPDALAAIVSYGRNNLPGLGDFPGDALSAAREPTRMYTESPIAGPNYVMKEARSGNAAFEIDNDVELAVYSSDFAPIPAALGAGPGVADAGSDDLIIEF